MKFVLPVLALLIVATTADAATLPSLQRNAQCVGGTLVATYADVQDGGGLAPYTNAGVIGVGDCAMVGQPGQCCALHARTNGGGFGGAIIPYTWLNYEVFEGATVQTGFSSYQTGALANQPGSLNNRTVGQQGTYYAGIIGGGATTPSASTISAALVANPASIDKGGSSLLTWSSTGAKSCTGNFPTGGATSGSVLVSPADTTVYTVTCSDQTASASSCLADGEEIPAGGLCDKGTVKTITWDQCCSGVGRYYCPARNEPAEATCGGKGTNAGGVWADAGYLPNPPNKCVKETCPTGVGTLPDPVSCSTVGATCQKCDGAPVGDANAVVNLYECRAGTATVGGKSASASATVTVDDGSFQVSCHGHPPRAGVGEDVLWSSTVSGGTGTYTYSWSGTDGLTGSTRDVFKKYALPGRKTAALTVTYTPSTTSVVDPGNPPQTPPVTPTVTTPTAPQTGGGGAGDPPLYLRYWNTLSSFLLFDRTDQQFDPGYVETVQMIEGTVQGATATTVAHTEGEMFTSTPVKQDMLTNGGVAFTETTFVGRTLASDQVTMDRVCTVLHGAGSTATQIGARGYNSCKNNGIIRYSGGKWESVSGCAGAHLSGSFSCVVPAPPPVAGTCTLSVSPSTITQGQSATLSWTSTGLTTLNISSLGAVTPVTSGSRTVSPSQTTTYTGSGPSSSTSTNFTPVSHAEGDAYSAPVLADISQNGGTTLPGPGIGFAAEQITMDRVCYALHGSGSTAKSFGARSYNSPGNNKVVRFNGTSWTAVGAKSFNSHLSSSFVCLAPQTAAGESAQCGSPATLTVLPRVSQPISKTVQCDNAVTVGTPECSDGIDNDGDGLSDRQDPQCLVGAGDGTGTGTYNPNGDSESGARLPECSDGIDNNGDGTTDWPDDPGCTSADDNLEYVDPAELTLSTSPALIKKNQQCTIAFSAKFVRTCSLSGAGVSRVFSATRGVIERSEVMSPALTQTTTYTLSCAGLDGKTVSKKVDCKIAPTFQEI